MNDLSHLIKDGARKILWVAVGCAMLASTVTFITFLIDTHSQEGESSALLIPEYYEWISRGNGNIENDIDLTALSLGLTGILITLFLAVALNTTSKESKTSSQEALEISLDRLTVLTSITFAFVCWTLPAYAGIGDSSGLSATALTVICGLLCLSLGCLHPTRDPILKIRRGKVIDYMKKLSDVHGGLEGKATIDPAKLSRHMTRRHLLIIALPIATFSLITYIMPLQHAADSPPPNKLGFFTLVSMTYIGWYIVYHSYRSMSKALLAGHAVTKWFIRTLVILAALYITLSNVIVIAFFLTGQVEGFTSLIQGVVFFTPAVALVIFPYFFDFSSRKRKGVLRSIQLYEVSKALKCEKENLECIEKKIRANSPTSSARHPPPDDKGATWHPRIHRSRL